MNADEIAFVLAVQHIFRARRNKDTLKEQFAAGDLNGKKFRMSIDRYTAIMAALSVNWNTLAPLINEAFLFGLSPTTEMVVDEAIYRFFSTFHDPKPGKKKPSPQRFIPRKPNPNGLQALLGAVKINGIPYITCLIPDSDATNPLQIRDALAFAAAEFKRVFGFYPHIVADAGFSGQDLLKFLTNLDCPFTLSVNSKHMEWLHYGLNYYCANHKWLVVKDPYGRIWSMNKNNDDNQVQFLVSNAYLACPKNSIPTIPQEDIQILAKLSPTTLNYFLSLAEVPPQLDPLQAAHALALKANRQYQQNVPILPQQVPAGKFSKADLDKMPVKNIVRIIRDAGWRKVSDNDGKPALVEIVLKSQSLPANATTGLQIKLEHSIGASNPIPHVHYKQVFNGVDLHDRHWNEIQGHHTIRRWESKYIISVLQTFFVNSFACFKFFNSESAINFNKFCEDICCQIVEENQFL